jgi:uncharacterized membrane protein
MDVAAVVFVHVTAGAFSLVSGAGALFARKGEALHRLSGNVFFVSMIVMTVAAFIAAIANQQAINISASTVTFYMITTSWVAATRKDGEIGQFETFALFGGLGVVATAAWFAVVDKPAAPVHYVFGSVAAIAVRHLAQRNLRCTAHRAASLADVVCDVGCYGRLLRGTAEVRAGNLA